MIGLIVNIILDYLKNTHSGKATSNKTPVLKKSKNMDIWVVGTSS